MTAAQHGSALRRSALPVGLILLLLILNTVKSPGFLAVHSVNGALTGSLIDIANRAAPVMILAFGMTLVIATGGIDLSVGSLVAISGSLTAYLITSRPNLPVFGALTLSLGLSLILGAINGLLVGTFRIQPIVATLVLMVSGRGVAQLLTQGQMIRLSDQTLSYWKAGRLFGLPTSIYLALVAGLLLFALTRGTALGLFLEATGDSERAAETAGIDVRGVKLAAYAVSGLCAGLAGLVIMSDTHVADANSAGLYMELDAILAVVLGGTLLKGGRFSLAGSVLGALLIQTLTTTILTTGVKPEANLIVKATMVLVACLLQSERFRAKFRRKA
ncbi:ABC transporter permease [Fimbriimonas ginsengisoli]|uniref:YtfT n=1 Tax=Fimbriimonas ginsengisoli Gsoil 348 TaxID=661478 RepID=A0A068NM62_FIMGI|nr:ABC transporter permease [Fimbriimonas ginsengisoli]AIE84648.1 YtfT [Fimbriimonas ginsengisoli Gsoil 348]